MITAIDTNILIDVFTDDRVYGTSSANALRKCLQSGALVVCDIVLAETATAFTDRELLNHAFRKLQIRFLPMTEESALYAADIWRAYRSSGGKRKRMIADFLIAAHATCQCDRLLSRDRGFYRTYFHELTLFEP